MSDKKQRVINDLEKLGEVFGISNTSNQAKEEKVVKTAPSSKENIRVSLNPLEVFKGIQIVPKVKERNVTTPLGEGREAWTIYYKWLIHHKPGCKGPAAWELTKFNDKELKYPVKINGKVLDKWVSPTLHNSQISPTWTVKVRELTKSNDTLSLFNSANPNFEMKDNNLYPKKLSEVIKKLNHYHWVYTTNGNMEELSTLTTKCHDFSLLNNNESRLSEYIDFGESFDELPETYCDDWDIEYVYDEQLEKIRSSYDDIDDYISSLQKEIEELEGKQKEIRDEYYSIAEELKKYELDALSQNDWLHSLTGGERNSIHSIASDDLPEWDYHDPNAIVVLCAANAERGNVWDKSYTVDYLGHKNYSEHTFTIIIDSDCKFWKYPKLSELAELKLSQEEKDKRFMPLSLMGPSDKDPENTIIDPDIDHWVRVGYKDYCKLLGVAGRIREGRKGKAELIFY